jgi:hypothetical protein
LFPLNEGYDEIALMENTFLSLDELPERYDIVGCAWPLDENPDIPREDRVRPCIVLEQRIQDDDLTGVRYGVLRFFPEQS